MPLGKLTRVSGPAHVKAEDIDPKVVLPFGVGQVELPSMVMQTRREWVNIPNEGWTETMRVSQVVRALDACLHLYQEGRADESFAALIEAEGLLRTAFWKWTVRHVLRKRLAGGIMTQAAMNLNMPAYISPKKPGAIGLRASAYHKLVAAEPRWQHVQRAHIWRWPLLAPQSVIKLPFVILEDGRRDEPRNPARAYMGDVMFEALEKMGLLDEEPFDETDLTCQFYGRGIPLGAGLEIHPTTMVRALYGDGDGDQLFGIPAEPYGDPITIPDRHPLASLRQPDTHNAFFETLSTKFLRDTEDLAKFYAQACSMSNVGMGTRALRAHIRCCQNKHWIAGDDHAFHHGTVDATGEDIGFMEQFMDGGKGVNFSQALAFSDAWNSWLNDVIEGNEDPFFHLLCSSRPRDVDTILSHHATLKSLATRIFGEDAVREETSR